MFVFIVGGDRCWLVVWGLWYYGEIMGVCGIVGDKTWSYGPQTEVKMASGTIKTRVGLVCGVQTEVMMASVTIEPLGLGSLWPFKWELWDVWEIVGDFGGCGRLYFMRFHNNQ